MVEKIQLRENTPSSGLEDTENLLGTALTNSQVDDNFQFLNQNKLDKDGKVVANSINIDGITISKNNSGQLAISGTVNAADGFVGEDISELTVQSKYVVLGVPEIQSIEDANTGGMKLGDVEDGASNGFVNLIFDSGTMCWTAAVYDDPNDAYEPYIGFNADDFIIRDTEITLLNINDNLIDAEEDITNLRSDVDGLIAEDLPTLVNQVKGNVSTEFELTNENESVLNEFDTVFEALDKINKVLLYTIHKVETKTNDFSANSSTFYIVNPVDSETPLIVSLPTGTSGGVPVENRGLVSFKLIGNGSMHIKPNNNDKIENDIGSTNNLIIDVPNITVQLIWDSANSSWRVM